MNITVRYALETFPEAAPESMKKELQQMLDKGVFQAVRANELPLDQLKRRIPSSMFLKEKFDAQGQFEKLKSRLVAGGHRQDKELYGDISSPTASTTALMIVCALAAREHRRVITMDITGAYLNANMKGVKTHMLLDSTLSTLLSDLNPIYNNYKDEKGRVTVLLKKALYGCVESAKLWFEHLSNTLVSLGFKNNWKEACVFNRFARGVQTTIVVYVDDLFITSEDESDLELAARQLQDAYGDVTIKRGEVHSYLGMKLDFSEPGVCSVSMPAYVDTFLREYKITRRYSSPSSLDLFSNHESPLLDSDKADQFRSRRLERLLGYINETKEDKMYLTPSDELTVHSYIDASWAGHEDRKSHTGVVVSLGGGPVYCESSKQTLVTTSSTEAELVGMGDGINMPLWIREFLQLQGYTVGPAKVYQDNMGTIAMAVKGKVEAKHSKHISIRYFQITDRIEMGEVELVHQRTDCMVADLLTKPLIGAQFDKLKGILLGTSPAPPPSEKTEKRSDKK
eukprot:gene34339-biopygen9391